MSKIEFVIRISNLLEKKGCVFSIDWMLHLEFVCEMEWNERHTSVLPWQESQTFVHMFKLWSTQTHMFQNASLVPRKLQFFCIWLEKFNNFLTKHTASIFIDCSDEKIAGKKSGKINLELSHVDCNLKGKNALCMQKYVHVSQFMFKYSREYFLIQKESLTKERNSRKKTRKRFAFYVPKFLNFDKFLEKRATLCQGEGKLECQRVIKTPAKNYVKKCNK